MKIKIGNEEIIITVHARDRIVERVGCSPRKVEKLIIKAWEHGTEPLRWFLERREVNKHHEGTIYKVYMGGAFVFIPQEDQKGWILTTCLNYDHKIKPILPH